MSNDFKECLDCQCLSARKQAQRLTRAYDEKLRPHELTVNQFSMLTALIVGGPTTISALAERLGVDRTTLSRNIALAETRGWVAVRSGKDARERVVAVTEPGLVKAKSALPAWRAANAAAGGAEA